MATSISYTNARDLARSITHQAAEERAITITRDVMRETSMLERATGLSHEDAARIAEAHLFTN